MHYQEMDMDRAAGAIMGALIGDAPLVLRYFGVAT